MLVAETPHILAISSIIYPINNPDITKDECYDIVKKNKIS